MEVLLVSIVVFSEVGYHLSQSSIVTLSTGILRFFTATSIDSLLVISRLQSRQKRDWGISVQAQPI